MSAMASQTTGVSIVYSTVCSGVDQRKHQSSPSLAFVRGIHRWPVNSPHKGPVTWTMFPFDDAIMRMAPWILVKYPVLVQLMVYCQLVPRHYVNLRLINANWTNQTDKLQWDFYRYDHFGDITKCHLLNLCCVIHDDVIKWKHFPRYWLFVVIGEFPAKRPMTRSFDVCGFLSAPEQTIE